MICDVQIWDFLTIAPRAVLLDRVKISNNVCIGANSIILINIQVGKNSIFQAGEVVTKDVTSNFISRGASVKF